MNKRFSLTIFLLFSLIWLRGQTCSNDTIFSDVIFLVDNSGSIDSAEYVAFSNTILTSVNKVQANCPRARVAVVHYGGMFGQETTVEYPLSDTNSITAINRQYCTSLNMFGFCNGGGGDDLNSAIGDLITYLGNGTLNHNTDNNLRLVIFTDAFDGAASCGQPNCSILRPFTNIDLLKNTYDANVTVVGVSPQANAALLQIYASPGGSYSLVSMNPADCTGTADGCVQPRKYIPIDFNSDINVTSDSVTNCVACQFQVVAGMMVEAGDMQMVCGDLSQSATLTAAGSVGVLPYSYVWSNGAGNTATVNVSPSVTTTYYVTATDAINCSHVDSVTVKVENCCTGFSVDAGQDTTICGNLGGAATLSAIASGSGISFTFNWDNGLGAGPSHVVSPSSATTYSVTATDNLGCTTSDDVTVNVNICCSGFSVTMGPDISICGDLMESTTISVTPTGGTGPFSYSWDNGLADQASHIVMPSVTTTYNVTVTDNAGCTASTQIAVVVNACGPNCDPDTSFTDVIFLVDNSGSIDDSEFAAFKNILEGSLAGICATCPSSRRGVVHYGGANGLSTAIEYPLGTATETSSINRQFCTSRNGFGLCVGGGGDDLNNAIGDIMGYIDNGMLSRNPANKLALVIFTDAFSFDTSCGHPNCSLILPTTNIDLMKANYGVDVAVVGMSSQAEETLLGIYASPGGSFNGPLWMPDCGTSFDGCDTPRKYIQVEFNTPPGDVSDMITGFVSCTISIEPEVVVDAGLDVTICGNMGETATLTATVSSGTLPFLYNWSNGAGNISTVVVAPDSTTQYFVTVVDANDCSSVDSVLVNVIECDTCAADAGIPRPPLETCLLNGQALLPAVRNIGVVTPTDYEEVYILTNSELTILDYSIGTKNFIINQEGLYRIHMLIAEVSDPSDENYLDLNIIDVGTSNLIIIVNCINNHDICADFDFPGRVHQVFGPDDMMCMSFENSINLCWDRLDNDGDGLVDCADPDCKELVVCLENNLLACNDLTDNDLDGLVDCYDSDCFEFTLCFERGDQCNDGLDNDGDGLVDCEDPSCGDSNWCFEDSPFTCVDGKDNDFDGLIDCQEASCQKFIVCSEYSEAACNDGIDNDRDGLVDCDDGHCKELLGDICDPFEDNWDRCNDGQDNDGDGLIDCADPDCITQALINVGDNVNIAIKIDNATCPNNDNGKIRFVGIAQDPNFKYSIDGGFTFSASYEFSGLAVGPYNVVIKSQNGCLLNVDVDVLGQACEEICHNGVDDNADGLVDCSDPQCQNQPNSHDLQIVNIQGAECPDYNSGYFAIANMPMNMRFSIDGMNYQTLPQFSNLADGIYQLYYKDAFGCHGPVEVVIPQATFDSDNDGICDSDDQCPNVNDALIGLSCNDGDPCTINDVYNPACQCRGVFADSDNDGICDAEDQCPDQNDGIAGMSCDDGDPCTINDTNDGNCNCAGVFADADGDGICDAMDSCPNVNDQLIGQPCDDGDPCTINDSYTDQCNCAGLFMDSDGDGICDADDTCPDNNVQVGTPCDDEDPCTVDDVYTPNCECAGQFKDTDGDGVCDFEDRCPGQDDANCWEACDNGIDDDGDGLVDCDDPECGLHDFTVVGDTSTYIYRADEYEIFETDCTTGEGAVRFIVKSEYNLMVFLFDAPHVFSMEMITWKGVPSKEFTFSGLTPGIYTFMAFSQEGCVDPVTIVIPEAELCVEDCSNGIDDNGDGLVDCEDPLCLPNYNMDFSITESACDIASGRVQVNNPHPDFFYWLTPFEGNPDGIFEQVPIGHYRLAAINACDTMDAVTILVTGINGCDGTNVDCENIPSANDSVPGEICDNGVDDDGDGLIDCDDGDCCTTQGVCAATHPDYQALMDIYHSTIGSNWNENDGWTEGAAGTSCDPCNFNGGQWYGVECSGGRVTELNLRAINLTGHLPGTIGNLTELKVLRLDRNAITGNIPEEIGALSKLTDLALYVNQFTGSIPVSLSQLSNLTNFALQDNNLTCEIPPELGLLTNLTGVFQLHGNQLTGSIPPELGNLRSQNLTLSYNKLTGVIPEALFENQNLSRIDFNDNLLEGPIPLSISNLPRLEGAFFHNNNLDGCFDDSLLSLCAMGQSSGFGDKGYNFLGNPLLPWEGDFGRFCNGEGQVGAICDEDNDENTHDTINENCLCTDSAPNTGAAVSGNMNINVMLQGASDPLTGAMKTSLNEGGYLPGQQPVTFFGKATPAGQPFNTAPWFYEGAEGTNLKSKKKSNEPLYDPEVVDWILVSLRTAPEKPTEVWRGAALLYHDGFIEFFDSFNVEKPNRDGYYIVIEHRNHLPAMSHVPVPIVNGSITYDFTKQNSFTSILGVGQVEDEFGNYMMLAGNGELILELSSDIDINARDLTLWLQNNGANSSYFLEDYDMNGDINIKDRILWEKNNGLFTTLQTK